MKKETTYQKIVKHIRPEYYVQLDTRIDEIEKLIREAYALLEKYKNSKTKSIPEYQGLIDVIESFRRDRWSPNPKNDSLGMYDRLSESTKLDIKVAMKQLRKRLAKDNIDVDTMIMEASEIGDFSKWAEMFASYKSRMHYKGHVTLNDYVKAKEVVKLIENAGNNGTSSIIVPMKMALEKYRLTLFDVIRFSDPEAEKQLQAVKDYETSIDLEAKKVAGRRNLTQPSNVKIIGYYGDRSMIVGQAPHHIEDGYSRDYDAIHTNLQPTLTQIYSMPLSELAKYKLPDVTTSIQGAIDSIDNPTN